MIKHIDLPNYTYDQKVYRYLSIEKFIHMISSNSFVLPRITLFNDIFEGTYPKKYVESSREYMKDIFEELGHDINKFKPNKSIDKTAFDWRENHFVSCWHANDFESEAMWRLYSNYNKGIAIISSIQSIIENFPEYYDNKGFNNPLFIGEVKYLDFKNMGKELFVPGHPIIPCLLKRKSFDYEREVRIYCHITSGWGNETEGIQPIIDGNIVSFPIDYNRLIHKIIIAPDSPNWYYEVIDSICEKFSINIPIEKSEILGEPIVKFWGNEWY